MADITNEKEIVVAGGLGNATPDKVLAGSTFSSESGFNLEGGFIPSAENISYDNTESGLAAENTQEAVDELKNKVDEKAENEVVITSDKLSEWSNGNTLNPNVSQYTIHPFSDYLFANAKNTGGGTLYKSEDGVAWKKIKSLPSYKQIAGHMRLNNKDVLCTSNTLYFLENGEINLPETLQFPSGITGFSNICSNGNIAVAGTSSGKIIYSENGIDWNATDVSTGKGMYVFYANGLFVGISGNGGSVISTAWYSEDGINWNEGNIETPTVTISFAYGNNRYVAISSNKILYSEDGINWNLSNTKLSGTSRVIFENGIFVALSEKNEIAFSKDAIDWTIKTTNFNLSSYFGIAGYNGRIVVVGNNGVSYYADFINETKKTQDAINELYNKCEKIETHEHPDYAPKNSPTFEGSISLGRKEGSTVGENSFAVGVNVIASDKASYAEGIFTQSLGEGTHVEGYCPRGIYLEIVDGQEGYRLLDQNKTKLPNWLNGYYWDAGIESAIETNGMPLYGLGLYDVEDKTLLKATIIKTYTVQTDNGYDLYAILDTDLSAEISANPDRGYYTYYGKAIKRGSHAECGGIALGDWGHAEGSMTWAAGQGHVEGHLSAAMNTGAHAENIKNVARGKGSHAQGTLTQALGDYSHTEGIGTKAASKYQHVQGKYNVEDTEEKYAHIVGGGTSDTDRKNIHTVDWEGNAEYAGDVKATDPYGKTISLLALRNYITMEIIQHHGNEVISPNNSATYEIPITKNGYIPIMATWNNDTYTNIGVINTSILRKDDGEYYLHFVLFNRDDSAAETYSTFNVLYVRDI